MEPVKHRGKSTKDGQWVYGFHVEDVEWGKHYIYHQVKGSVFYQLSHTEVSEESVSQFAGIKDKYGIDIYNGDTLRIRFDMGRSQEYISDGVYKVCVQTPYPVRFSFVELHKEGHKYNQIPIIQSMEFGKEITFDHQNSLYKNAAIQDVYWDGYRVIYYSNDIEVNNESILNPKAA